MPRKPAPKFLKDLYYAVFIFLFSGHGVECPICGIRLRRFVRAGKIRVSEWGNLCPRCWSLERHRLLWLFIKNRTDFFDGNEKTVLHVAPEPCFKGCFENLKNMNYIVSDLGSSDPKKRIDLTAIPFDDRTIDVILCNNVFEHIPEDTKAMRECARVLKNTGWAILNVPVDYNREITYEDPTIQSPADRLKHYAHEEHVRFYGRDYPARLAAAGFRVDEINYYRDLVKDGGDRYGLLEDEMVFYCRTRVSGEKYFTDPSTGSG